MRTLRTAVAGIAVATILVGCQPERGGTIVLTNADVPDGVILSVGLRVTDPKLKPYGIVMDVGRPGQAGYRDFDPAFKGKCLDLAHAELDVRTGQPQDASKFEIVADDPCLKQTTRLTLRVKEKP